MRNDGNSTCRPKSGNDITEILYRAVDRVPLSWYLYLPDLLQGHSVLSGYALEPLLSSVDKQAIPERRLKSVRKKILWWKEKPRNTV